MERFSVCLSVRPSVHPSPLPEAQPARPEAQPARPEAQPARPEAQPAGPESQPAGLEAQPARPEAQPARSEAQPDSLWSQMVDKGSLVRDGDEVGGLFDFGF